MPNIKPKSKAIFIVAAAIALFLFIKYAASHGILPSSIGKILTPAKANLPDVKDAEIPNVKPVAYPSSGCTSVPGPLIRGEIWEWNAANGLLLATGGNCTTKGSLMQNVSDHLWLLGKGRDGEGKIIPGAYILETIDLIARDLAWHENIRTTPEFAQAVVEIEQKFVNL